MLVHPVLRTQIYEPHVYGNKPGNRAGLCAASSAAKIICAFQYALIPLKSQCLVSPQSLLILDSSS